MAVTYSLGKDIGIKPIHLKSSTREMNEILEDINEYLFFFSYLYIGDSTKSLLKEKIREIGLKLKEMDVPLAKANGKQEFREKLLEIYNSLDKYTCYYTDRWKMLEDKMNNFQVSKYLKEKKEGMTIKQQLEWLYKINLFKQAYNLNDNLISVNNELLNNFKL